MTPTSEPCVNLVINGGFEWRGAWALGRTPYQADYTTQTSHTGLWSMRHGIESGLPLKTSHSSVYQMVSIPADATEATLRFWWRRFTEETPAYLLKQPLAPEDRPPLSALGYSGDTQEVLVLHGVHWTVLKMLARVRLNEGVWVEERFDLSEFAGQRIVLYFNCYNDGYGGRTWMYLDDVSLTVCSP